MVGSAGGSLSHLSDEVLLCKYIETLDQSLFRELYERYREPLLNFATSKVGDKHAAEDIVQAALFKAHDARVTYNRQYRVSPWLYSIVRNMCKNHTKPREETLSTIGIAAEIAAEDKTRFAPPSECMEREQTALLVKAIVNEAAPDLRQAIQLIFYGGMSYSEAAEELNMNRGTLATRMSRLFQYVRQRFQFAEAA